MFFVYFDYVCTRIVQHTRGIFKCSLLHLPDDPFLSAKQLVATGGSIEKANKKGGSLKPKCESKKVTNIKLARLRASMSNISALTWIVSKGPDVLTTMNSYTTDLEKSTFDCPGFSADTKDIRGWGGVCIFRYFGKGRSVMFGVCWSLCAFEFDSLCGSVIDGVESRP